MSVPTSGKHFGPSGMAPRLELEQWENINRTVKKQWKTYSINE